MTRLWWHGSTVCSLDTIHLPGSWVRLQYMTGQGRFRTHRQVGGSVFCLGTRNPAGPISRRPRHRQWFPGSMNCVRWGIAVVD